jgi:hypothetical protein
VLFHIFPERFRKLSEGRFEEEAAKWPVMNLVYKSSFLSILPSKHEIIMSGIND